MVTLRGAISSLPTTTSPFKRRSSQSVDVWWAFLPVTTTLCCHWRRANVTLWRCGSRWIRRSRKSATRWPGRYSRACKARGQSRSTTVLQYRYRHRQCFLDTHNRYLIACPYGQAMGCLLWVLIGHTHVWLLLWWPIMKILKKHHFQKQPPEVEDRSLYLGYHYCCPYWL